MAAERKTLSLESRIVLPGLGIASTVVDGGQALQVFFLDDPGDIGLENECDEGELLPPGKRVILGFEFPRPEVGLLASFRTGLLPRRSFV